MVIGGRVFDTKNRHYIMGILNVTPDSFSDGGKWDRLDDALSFAGDMINEGADIIDVGGESTRPGYTAVTEQEELDRVVPVIEALRARFDIPVSVDTCKSAVARVALRAGADMVNDITGLKGDPEMAGLIASAEVPCCIMHNRATADYKDFIPELLDDLRLSADIALKAGISADRMILDPGIGFGKTYENNLEAINRLDKIADLGYPVLLGASRKSFIGKALDLPVDERLEGTIAATVIGMLRGCTFFRVHDVRETKRAIIMTEAITGEITGAITE